MDLAGTSQPQCRLWGNCNHLIFPGQGQNKSVEEKVTLVIWYVSLWSTPYFFSLKSRRLRGGLINVLKYLKGGCQKDVARLFSVVSAIRVRDYGQTEAGTWGLPPKHEEELNWVGDWALEQDAWRSCGISFSGDNQKPSGHSSECGALRAPAWAGMLDQVTSGGVPSSPILWFSVIYIWHSDYTVNC